MNQPFLDQLEQWHQQDEFQKIIDAIEAIPEGERGYTLTGLLARAYENAGESGETEPYEMAISLLQSIREEGGQDPNWHFRMGYALYWLDREPEAIPYFRRVLTLIPDDPETQEFWSDCRELLARCEAERERREAQAQYSDENTLDPEKALNYLLHVSLHNSLGSEDRVEGGSLYLPEWDLTVTPEISQLTERGAVVNFYLYAPQWGRELFECSVGMGGDPKQALGMASASFLLSLMQGIGRMERREDPRPLETEFAGKRHRWQVYLSDVIGIGESPQLESAAVYWDALKDEIVKRLGNQTLCYVKIYGAKMGDDVTGECRIDDRKSEELSALVAEMVSKWEVQQFASQKQFFLLRQEEETTLPNPYLGREGQERLKSRVIESVRMFHACAGQEAYDALPDRMAEALGDSTLAAECYAFLPEMCAQNAFDELSYPETMQIQSGAAPVVTCYQNQLSDYWPIWHALFAAFGEGVFGDETDDIYRKLIGTSSIYNVIEKMRKDGSELENCRLTSLRFQVGEDFELR